MEERKGKSMEEVIVGLFLAIVSVSLFTELISFLAR